MRKSSREKKNGIKTNNDTAAQPNQYSNGDVGDDDDIQNGYTIPNAIIFSSEPLHCNTVMERKSERE